MAGDVDLADVQGNILCGYRLNHVRHLVLRVDDAAAARAAIGAMAGGDAASFPQVTSAEPWGEKPGYCLNTGITFTGLRALGVPGPSLAGFPPEFREGMARRAGKLGDFGPSAPDRWTGGLGDTDRVHLVVTIHTWERQKLEALSRTVENGRAFETLSRQDGAALPDGKVHFGYRDGIAQPRFLGIHDPEEINDEQPLVPLGTVLLGHPTPFPGLRWRVPEPEALGRNGAFNAFRVLEQDVAAFETFLEDVAKEHPALTPELVAAKLCGRWRNGVPVMRAPLGPPPDPEPGDRTLNDFDYDDLAGGICPMGAHIRRCNPRSARVVQRGANHTRRIVRRGIPYGPAFDPEHPDDLPRGLLGNFICASLAAQFEAIQYDWMNLGLHDPRVSGTNDVLTGANDPATSRFEIPVEGADPIVLSGFPRFVTTRGGAYTFLPSLTALRWIAALPKS
ncbi:MAG: hypothetical protein QOF96_2920 [Actinomycetota bacterium]|nr:hypothetical protein [Actinomycetota bacterium]